MGPTFKSAVKYFEFLTRILSCSTLIPFPFLKIIRVRPFLKWVFLPVIIRRIKFLLSEVDWSTFTTPGEKIQILDITFLYLEFFGDVAFDGILIIRGRGPRAISLATDLIFKNNTFFWDYIDVKQLGLQPPNQS